MQVSKILFYLSSAIVSFTVQFLFNMVGITSRPLSKYSLNEVQRRCPRVDGAEQLVTAAVLLL